ncbi:serine/threonine-protein kinase [Nostoc parmelioides]|uniref:non-specific serine/threonine protein kinase n=1 Tax=Nostoc parmelioides FACHB-3921 TaxID=2692909 RepID=A0ABR8BPA2_9NOSO|nr:serine/threonine-protein kinase [Nostoc parmelioides]MBD2255813.1 protein kinase [Nostoc parmelioides FACHB-3921]
MSCYCINPLCEQRENADDADRCQNCGTSLVINKRIRLLKPLRELSESPFTDNEIFEVEDAGTEWNPGSKRRIMKVLKWGTAGFIERFEREVTALDSIDHPNIPQTNGVDDYFTFAPNRSPFNLRCLVIDKIEGQDLEEWIENHPPISQDLALNWLEQILAILHAVHQAGFFHRDIKPSNIIVNPEGELFLIDFGAVRRVSDTYLAKVGAGERDVRTGKYQITSVISHYYSPLEQINGKAVPQSDFYALGRTMIRLVTGVNLIDLPTDNKGRIIWKDKAIQIDKPFADLLDQLMASNPGQRPSTTEIILWRLKKLPGQNKIYRITRSKPFIFSVAITSISLIGLLVYTLGLPAYANNLVVQGQKLEAANKNEQAQKLFDQAVKIRPELSNQISKFYFDKAARVKDNLQLEKKYYTLAIKYNPNDIDSYNNLALTCQFLRNVDCVNKTYEQLFRLEPNSWTGYYNLANFYEEQEKYDLAEKQYKLAIEYGQEQALIAVNNLSRLNNLQGKYAQAQKLATEGLKKAPLSDKQLRATLYKNLAWAKLMQKDYQGADKDLQTASKLDSQRVDVYCLLSKTKEALGDINSASGYGEVCLLARMDTWLPEVQKWRGELIERIFKSK